jgi:HK97 family phage major capsid protein
MVGAIINSRAAFDVNARDAISRTLSRVGTHTEQNSGVVDYSLPPDLTRSFVSNAMGIDTMRIGTEGLFGGTQLGATIKPEFSDIVADRQRPITVPSGLVEWVPTTTLEWTMPTVSENNTDAGRYGNFIPNPMLVDEITLPPATDSKVGLVKWVNKRFIIFTTLSRDVWEDATRLRVWMDKMALGAIQYYINKAIVMGITGGPQGVANAPGTVTIAKQSGQASGTIVSANIDQMWSALYAGSKQRAVWLANDDALDAIDQLTTGATATASQEINYISFVPAGRYGQPFPTLKGRPIIPCEYCPAIGTPGDLILWDPSDWLLTYRTAAPNIGAIAISVDVPPGPHWSGAYGLPNDAVERRMSDQASQQLFFSDQLAIYWKMRMDCNSLWTTTAVNRNGATVGNAVVIAQR